MSPSYLACAYCVSSSSHRADQWLAAPDGRLLKLSSIIHQTRSLAPRVSLPYIIRLASPAPWPVSPPVYIPTEPTPSILLCVERENSVRTCCIDPGRRYPYLQHASTNATSPPVTLLVSPDIRHLLPSPCPPFGVPGPIRSLRVVGQPSLLEAVVWSKACRDWPRPDAPLPSRSVTHDGSY